jgi:TPR repeat protein
MVNLANMYLAGRGVPQSDADAIRWYREAAERGDRSGQRMMGVMYSAGRGVPKDDQEAARWFRLAAGEKV